MFKSWSYSRLSDYTLCPLKAQLKHLQKIPEPKAPALARGIRVHEAIEKYLKSADELPDDLGLHAKALRELDELREYLADTNQDNANHVEPSAVLTKDWQVTTFDDWSGAWLRAKLDVAYFIYTGDLRVIDWKTGTFRQQNVTEYLEQLELYALIALLVIPKVKIVVPSLYYVDHGIRYPDTLPQFTTKDIPRLKKKWVAKVKPMFADNTFAPRPNFSCRWCHYGQTGKKLCKF